MARSLYQELARKQREVARDENWFTCVPAIVANVDDDAHQHRIQVKIPIIDEEKIHDEWIKQLGPHAGAGGNGSFSLPKVGQEVMLFSEFGQGENLYYLCVYNEDNQVSGDCEDETVMVVRTDGDYKLIISGNFYLSANKILMESDSSARIIAPASVHLDDKK